MLQALLLALIAAVGFVRAVTGQGLGLLPLLAAGPPLGALIGGTAYVLAVGAEALAVHGFFFATGMLGPGVFFVAVVGAAAVAVTTAGAALATTYRARRERELAQVRLVADATQQLVLHPVPREAGPVRFAARYLSAAERARVGGDLYDVVATPGRIRFLIGDAKGKGLPALRAAMAVLGVFRDVAYDTASLAEIAARIDLNLARRFSSEDFVTAILAEVSMNGASLKLLNCGHPAPLLLGRGRPQLITSGPASLPLGLGHLGGSARAAVTVPLAPGDHAFFYTDGITEARNSAGDFFPLQDSPALRTPRPPDTLLDRLTSEMTRFTGHPPADDLALLLLYL